MALLMAFERANGLDVSAEENVTLGREVENDYLGLRSGILDQAAILHSRRDALTLIDCATGGHERLAAPRTMPRFTTVLAFSGLRQALVGTDYNRRVDECAEAACVLLAAAGRPDQRTLLGNVQAAEYQEFKHLLKDAPARRAAHFFGEVDRVRQGVDAWKSGDLARFGGLMTASGASSIELYECGSPPLIDLYHLLVGSDGVLGARFSGAGFRGCCVALASPDAAEEVAAGAGRVRPATPGPGGQRPVVLCSSDDGAEGPDMSSEVSSSVTPFPRSIAIAGAWGYIGRKFLDVSLSRGLEVHVLDPGPLPADVDASRIHRVDDPAEFYALKVDLFHLAVHPEFRREDLLLNRADGPWILNEKPMALPERPERCAEVVAAAGASPALMLYDFPELYDPLTDRVINFLRRFEQVRIDEFVVRRSKDREDPANPRNRKRMVSIQYQESVHCIAYVLHVLARVRGGLDDVTRGGLRVSGHSALYDPPNPEEYPRPVDGRCEYRMDLAGVSVDGLTDFKRGAPWAKTRHIRGVGDGRPFEIEVSYLEGKKWLKFDGEAQECDPDASSYEHVLATFARWAREYGRDRLMTGVFPNPGFTRLTYQLSAALWRSCQDGRELAFDTRNALESWDARDRATPAD
ncbi:MAG: hypothetical protein U0835_14750 [Isosphaeraceae bacterium]